MIPHVPGEETGPERGSPGPRDTQLGEGSQALGRGSLGTREARQCLGLGEGKGGARKRTLRLRGDVTCPASHTGCPPCLWEHSPTGEHGHWSQGSFGRSGASPAGARSLVTITLCAQKGVTGHLATVSLQGTLASDHLFLPHPPTAYSLAPATLLLLDSVVSRERVLTGGLATPGLWPVPFSGPQSLICGGNR